MQERIKELEKEILILEKERNKLYDNYFNSHNKKDKNIKEQGLKIAELLTMKRNELRKIIKNNAL